MSQESWSVSAVPLKNRHISSMISRHNVYVHLVLPLHATTPLTLHGWIHQEHLFGNRGVHRTHHVRASYSYTSKLTGYLHPTSWNRHLQKIVSWSQILFVGYLNNWKKAVWWLRTVVATLASVSWQNIAARKRSLKAAPRRMPPRYVTQLLHQNDQLTSAISQRVQNSAITGISQRVQEYRFQALHFAAWLRGDMDGAPTHT